MNFELLPQKGCPEPKSCKNGAQMKIIDAWKRMHSGATSYGFVAQIFVPEPVNTGDWSILVRFSPLNTKELFLNILCVM